MYLCKNISSIRSNNKKLLNKLFDEAAHITPARLTRLVTATVRKNWRAQVEKVIVLTGESFSNPRYYYGISWDVQNQLILNEEFNPEIVPSLFEKKDSLKIIRDRHNHVYGLLSFANPKFKTESSSPGMIIIQFSEHLENKTFFDDFFDSAMEQIRGAVQYALNIRRYDMDEKIYRPFPEA
jgi:hypothetical protein